jgi:hypothetical protein
VSTLLVAIYPSFIDQTMVAAAVGAALNYAITYVSLLR